MDINKPVNNIAQHDTSDDVKGMTTYEDFMNKELFPNNLFRLFKVIGTQHGLDVEVSLCDHGGRLQLIVTGGHGVTVMGYANALPKKSTVGMAADTLQFDSWAHRECTNDPVLLNDLSKIDDYAKALRLLIDKDYGKPLDDGVWNDGRYIDLSDLHFDDIEDFDFNDFTGSPYDVDLDWEIRPEDLDGLVLGGDDVEVEQDDHLQNPERY